MRYELDAEGWLVACGDVNSYSYELTDEPFGMDGLGKWRKVKGEWIYNEITMIPQEITKLQAVKRLLDTGRYTDLMTAIDSDPTGESRILFDAASTLARDSNMVSQFAAALGFSDEDTDEFFVEADKIMV